MEGCFKAKQSVAEVFCLWLSEFTCFKDKCCVVLIFFFCCCVCLFWGHFETKTKRYLRGVMVSSCYAELHTVGNLGISLSCFSDSSSLPSNPIVTRCKGHGFGAKPTLVLASRIPYYSNFFFFPCWPNTSSKSNMSEPVSLSVLVVTHFLLPRFRESGEKRFAFAQQHCRCLSL